MKLVIRSYIVMFYISSSSHNNSYFKKLTLAKFPVNCVILGETVKGELLQWLITWNIAAMVWIAEILHTYK